MLPITEKRHCRVCLIEMRDKRTYTNFMQPPEPDVQIREGVRAKSYLECYYFCLKSNSIRFNITYLPNHQYICNVCIAQLKSTVNFIIKSQKNEEILKSIYDESTNPKSSSIAGNKKQFTTIKLMDTEDASPIDVIERCGDEVEILEDLQNKDILEIEALGEEDVIVECDMNRSNFENNYNEEMAGEVSHSIEVIMPKSKNSQSDNIKNGNASIAPKNPLSLQFNCQLCRGNFSSQRRLYQHYNERHDTTIFEFRCNLCEKLFISQKVLAFHKQGVHSNIQFVDCDICGQVVRMALLRQHKERHIHECYICGRTFEREILLNQHLTSVHGKIANPFKKRIISKFN